VKGKWAAGIAPRNFVWIVKDRLAVSERPGGYARNHRKIRRQEEILWLRNNGFTRVVSLLPSSHNLHAYEEFDVRCDHVPLAPTDDAAEVLAALYPRLREWLGTGERLLLHQEELSDVLMGVLAGYLLWAGLLPAGPHAITALEELCHRPMGPPGRELVAIAGRLRSAATP
jgi:hypothetical protein